jgi:hypothetical protein
LAALAIGDMGEEISDFSAGKKAESASRTRIFIGILSGVRVVHAIAAAVFELATIYQDRVQMDQDERKSA